MDFSLEAIKLLDYISEKLGIVIDWNSENIVPALQDMAGKYIRYEITTSIMWIVVLLFADIALIILIRNGIKSGTEESQAYAICGIALLLGPIAVQISQVLDIVRCVVFPEYQIFNYLQEIVKQSLK